MAETQLRQDSNGLYYTVEVFDGEEDKKCVCERDDGDGRTTDRTISSGSTKGGQTKNKGSSGTN